MASPRVNQYERGKHLPDPLILERLGAVLNRPLPYFYAADEDMAAVITLLHRAKATQRKRWLADLLRKADNQPD